MKRRDFIKTAGGLVLLAGAQPWMKVLAEATPTGNSKRPMNLLFITADDMNATMPGWMGNPLKLTPNMDAFAATCHRFVANRSCVSVCQPSREAMMTGLVPHHSGAMGFVPIKKDTPTLATVLQSNGYFIGAINKIDHMVPRSCFPWDYQITAGGKNPPEIGAKMAEALAGAKTAGKPFFINCNILDPHRPFYGETLKNGHPEKDSLIDILARTLKPEDVTVPSFLENLPEIRTEYAHYCNSVQRLDLSFGKVMAALQASGEMDNTIVLFVSDHGMPFPFSKATLYTNGPWCPVIIHYPGMGTPQVREELTSSLDIMPSLLEILGITKIPAMDGRSWIPLLNGKTQPDRDYVISYYNDLDSGEHYPQRMVHTKTGSLFFSPWADGHNKFDAPGSLGGLTYPAMVEAGKTDPRIQARVDQLINGIPLAFYDLGQDPDERVNAINDPNHKDEVDRLKKILLAEMEKTQDPQLENYKTILSGGSIKFDTGTSKYAGHAPL